MSEQTRKHLIEIGSGAFKLLMSTAAGLVVYIFFNTRDQLTQAIREVKTEMHEMTKSQTNISNAVNRLEGKMENVSKELDRLDRDKLNKPNR